jgi:hypothetical protein
MTQAAMQGGDGERGHAIVARLGEMGLRSGDVLGGWTLQEIAPSLPAREVIVSFSRGPATVQARLAPSSNEGKRFARVGQVDLSHLPVDDRLTRAAGELMRAVAARLAQRAPGADLRPLFPAAAPAAPAAPTSAEASPYHDAGEAPELDPALRTPDDRPFMEFPTVDLQDLPRFGDALRRMHRGTLGGLVVRGVYSRPQMAAVVERLVEREAEFPLTSFPARFKASFYGRCLDGCDPELDEYLTDGARFRRELESTFEGAPPFEPRMEELFDALGGGARSAVPRFRDGRAYTSATIRILREGGQIGTHCGNEAQTRPAYTHLNTLVDRSDQLSYFLTLQDAVAGGELIVYSLKWSDVDASHIVGGRSQVEDLLRTAQWMRVSPGAGDLLIFDGGRYFHRVSPVQGTRMRWTVGGFLMFGTGGDRIFYWS